MTALTCNIAKGSEVGYYANVDAASPANSALIMMLLRTGGASLATLQDTDTFAAILALSTEVSAAGYARKTLVAADLTAIVVDDTNNRILLTLPLQTFALSATGQTIDIVVVGYDADTTGGTDANIVPITVAETREDGTAIPTLVGNVVVDYSSGWVVAT